MFFFFPFHRMADNTATRTDEAVASATSNNEAGNSAGDREVARTTTTASNAGKNKNKKKPAEKATSSSAVGESATVAKSEDAAKGPATVTREMWYEFDLSPSLPHFTRVFFPNRSFTRALTGAPSQ